MGATPTRQCVLVLDDEPLVLSAWRRRLRVHGFSTVCASDARTALSHLGSLRVFALVTDFHLVDETSLPVVLEAVLRGLQVVMVTADPFGARAALPPELSSVPVLSKTSGIDEAVRMLTDPDGVRRARLR